PPNTTHLPYTTLFRSNRKIDLDALQTLVKKSSISVKKEDLEKAQTDFKIAQVEYDMAVEQLRKRSITASCAIARRPYRIRPGRRSEEHTSELQSRRDL